MKKIVTEIRKEEEEKNGENRVTLSPLPVNRLNAD